MDEHLYEVSQAIKARGVREADVPDVLQHLRLEIWARPPRALGGIFHKAGLRATDFLRQERRFDAQSFEGKYERTIANGEL